MPRKERRTRKNCSDFAREQDADARPFGLGDDPDFRTIPPNRVGTQDPEVLADAQAVLAGILKRNLAPIAGGVATRGEAIPLSERPEEWVESLIGVVEMRHMAERIVDAFAAVTSERISEPSGSVRGFTAVVRENLGRGGSDADGKKEARSSRPKRCANFLEPLQCEVRRISLT